jgi:hypothetical protein
MLLCHGIKCAKLLDALVDVLVLYKKKLQSILGISLVVCVYIT